MEMLGTVVVLLPIIAIFIRTENRLSSIETNIKWIKEKLLEDKK
jgi:hypothetical protein